MLFPVIFNIIQISEDWLLKKVQISITVLIHNIFRQNVNVLCILIVLLAIWLLQNCHTPKQHGILTLANVKYVSQQYCSNSTEITAWFMTEVQISITVLIHNIFRQNVNVLCILLLAIWLLQNCHRAKQHSNLTKANIKSITLNSYCSTTTFKWQVDCLSNFKLQL